MARDIPEKNLLECFEKAEERYNKTDKRVRKKIHDAKKYSKKYTKRYCDKFSHSEANQNIECFTYNVCTPPSANYWLTRCRGRDRWGEEGISRSKPSAAASRSSLGIQHSSTILGEVHSIHTCDMSFIFK